jgi:quinol monooxygenase YgiN
MSRIGRYAKATAVAGKGDQLAELMLAVAATLHDTPGCELYVINRVPDEPDAVWVTELWSSQEACDAALASAGGDGGPSKEDVLALVEAFERIDLVPVGGVGVGG